MSPVGRLEPSQSTPSLKPLLWSLRSTSAERHSPHRPASSLGCARLRPIRVCIVFTDARTLPPLDAQLGSPNDHARQQSRGAALRMGSGMGEPLAHPRELP